MSCCPPTAFPALASDASAIVGFTTKHNITSLYVAAPAAGTVVKVGLLALPDILGPDSGHTKQDADKLATLGYAVVLVDLAAGDYMTLEEVPARIKDWCTQFSFEKVLSAAIQDALAYMQREFRPESIVSYGYCWGGYVGAHQSTLADPVIKGNISFHPSWVIENIVHGDGAVEKLATRINVPQLLLAAKDDPPFVRENGSVSSILAAKPETSAHSNVVDFPDVNHGWVNRGDLEKPEVKASVAKAWHLALKFIQTVAPQ